MTSYDQLIAALRENATETESDLGWTVKVHGDDGLLTHIFAATKTRHSTIADAWTAAQALFQLVKEAGYTPVYRIEVGVDSMGWRTEDGSPDGWYGTVETVARPTTGD
jgi:hypothetical protein